MEKIGPVVPVPRCQQSSWRNRQGPMVTVMVLVLVLEKPTKPGRRSRELEGCAEMGRG